MKKFSTDLKIVYQNVYQEEMKLWKGLAIYPKVIEQKPASDFTPEEKKHLTRKGFRWYVYYSFYNPDTDKFEKHIAPTLALNRRHPDFDERHKAFRRLKTSLKELLEDGRSPLELTVVDGEVLTIGKALDHGLELKRLTVSKPTYDNYRIRISQLQRYLKKRGMIDRSVQTFNFRIIREFLHDLARDSSTSNRNNALRAIRACWTALYKNDVVDTNYFERIDLEKTKSERFKSFTLKEATELIEYFEKHDPYLSLFLKFVGYNFLRLVEVARLKNRDIDLEEKTLTVFVKQGKYKTKRIPDDIVEDLKKYDLSKKDNLLFAQDRISGKWNISAASRRAAISKRITRVFRKLGYGEGYVPYSFRHTYATIGYRNLRKRLSKDEAMDELMGYTGHDTRDSLKKYIHYIDAEIVDEYDGIVE